MSRDMTPGVVVLLGMLVAAGCAHRAGPGEIAAEATAARADLGDCRVVEGETPFGDGEGRWAAYFDGARLRYVREQTRDVAGTADTEYWFEDRRLLAYVSRAEGAGGRDSTLYLGFDEAGALAERSKTVDGREDAVTPADVAGARQRAGVLEREAARALTTPTGQWSPAFTTGTTRAGLMTTDGEKLRFFACGEKGDGMEVQDFYDGRGASMIRDLGGALRPIPVLVRLEEERLREIRYAGPEGGCERLPPVGEVEARGNEPFWMLRVNGTEATLRTADMPDGVVFRDGSWEHPGTERWIYTARRGSAWGVEHLKLELTGARCTDTMSGAKFPMRASLVRDGTRVAGCALEGRGRRATTEAR